MDRFHEQFPETTPGTPGYGFHTGFMTGMLELGAFVGCLFFPKLADVISRKRAIVVAVGFFFVGSIIQVASFNYGTLVAGRAIGGIGVGTVSDPGWMQICVSKADFVTLARNGSSSVHCRDRTTQSSRKPTCSRAVLYRRGCHYSLLDCLRQQPTPIRLVLPPAVPTTDGARWNFGYRDKLFPVFSTMVSNERQI